MCLPNNMWLSCTSAVRVSSANTPNPIMLCIVMKYFWATYSYKFTYEYVKLLRCINKSYLVFSVGGLCMLDETIAQFEQVLNWLITFIPQVRHLHQCLTINSHKWGTEQVKNLQYRNKYRVNPCVVVITSARIFCSLQSFWRSLLGEPVTSSGLQLLLFSLPSTKKIRSSSSSFSILCGPTTTISHVNNFWCTFSR